MDVIRCYGNHRDGHGKKKTTYNLNITNCGLQPTAGLYISTLSTASYFRWDNIPQHQSAIISEHVLVSFLYFNSDFDFDYI